MSTTKDQQKSATAAVPIAIHRKPSKNEIRTAVNILSIETVNNNNKSNKNSRPNNTWCHTEIEVADPTFYLTQSQYTDTGPTSSSIDPIAPGAWQGSHWGAIF